MKFKKIKKIFLNWLGGNESYESDRFRISNKIIDERKLVGKISYNKT